ncbi:lysosomal Pro-X carboxypeptidase-like [Dorcoceras hygrometricum]|uniref:Lysosomal Pro-X carboxypeptidase-like n=1 Tax=Dorcoceras hygrometricum TaxID=472368 RepID=A0A2Z7BWQ4_9LAMI|nr:lysosomal Pro-X carboxypeptidase-like [Dorcoceras hygrometricum]
MIVLASEMQAGPSAELVEETVPDCSRPARARAGPSRVQAGREFCAGLAMLDMLAELLLLCVVRSLGVSFSREQQTDTASRGPTTIVAPESQFRTCPSDHDSIGYPRMSASGESSTTMLRLLHASRSHPIPPPDDSKTNQYNQDLEVIHSTNGNHLESPNEGSSIDHQVTIYLHAQNITMFPTNETWYFASQILVSSSGGLILILTAQSTRNVFRTHSDY